MIPYFKIACRSLYKRKMFSLINVAGLAIGISAALIIFLLVQFDFSFDKQHKDAGRIYRVVSESGPRNEVYKNPGVPVPMFTAIENEVTGIETAVPIIMKSYDVKVTSTSDSGISTIKYRDNAKLIYTNNNYFKLLNYEWEAGNSGHALDNPLQTVLTEERANVYFPHKKPADIIGKQLLYDDSLLTTVTGVVKALKENTDFTFKEFVSISTVSTSALKNNYNWDQWNAVNSDLQLFVKLSPGISSKKLTADLTGLLIKHKDEDPATSNSKLLLQPLSDIHFNAEYGTFDQRVANKPTLFALLIVALFLLLLGCINFINLSTAQASERAKEIGIRKTIGAFKGQLVKQFLMETVILTIAAAVISIFLAPVILNLFSDFIPPEINSSFIFTVPVFVFVLLLVIIVSLLSGLYPSLIITKYKPASVLKGQFTSAQSSKGNNNFRRVLTVFQFGIAQFFIIATLIVGQQVYYSLSKDLGFKKDAIAYIRLPWKDKSQTKKSVLLQKIKSQEGIELACLANSAPSSPNTMSSDIRYFNGKNDMETDVEQKYGGPDYFKLYQLKLLAGRATMPSDTISEYVINETYSKILGFAQPADAIGKMLDGGMSGYKIPIVGVMADFHTKSTHVAIKPLLVASGSRFNTIHFAFSKTAEGTVAWQRTLQKIEADWKEIYPGEPFEYTFFDESIAAFYKTETNTVKLLKWSSALAVFISCLGLLGLVIFMANKRTKEIGVRKVLGATTIQIVSMLSKDFIKLVLIALVIASPLAYYFMSKWLQDFVYRINIPIWVFAVTGIGAVLIAFATISYQSINAARANPVKSLRTE